MLSADKEAAVASMQIYVSPSYEDDIKLGGERTNGTSVLLDFREEVRNDAVCIGDLTCFEDSRFWLSSWCCEGREEEGWQSQEREEAGFHVDWSLVLRVETRETEVSM